MLLKNLSCHTLSVNFTPVSAFLLYLMPHPFISFFLLCVLTTVFTVPHSSLTVSNAACSYLSVPHSLTQMLHVVIATSVTHDSDVMRFFIAHDYVPNCGSFSSFAHQRIHNQIIKEWQFMFLKPTSRRVVWHRHLRSAPLIIA